MDFHERSTKICGNLKNHGILLVALDFDNTVVQVHTYGSWRGSASQLSTNIRPFFREFIPMALQQEFKIAIVTFSSQTSMIRDVLKDAFPDCEKEIVIRGKDNGWEYIGTGCRERKQPHIASVAEEIFNVHKLKIERRQTILIDDDIDNVKCALRNGTLAVHCDPSFPNRMVETLSQFC